MEKIAEFLGRAAAVIAFCAAVALTLLEAGILRNLAYTEPAAHVFKTVIR